MSRRADLNKIESQLAQNQEILRAEGEEVFNDPLEVRDFVLELLNVPLSEEGVHFVNLFSDNNLLSERRFTVQVIKQE